MDVRLCRFLILALMLFIAYSASASELKRRALLGLAVGEISNEIRQQLNLPPNHGVIVKNVIPGSSAQDAGFAIDDVLLKLNRTIITDTAAFLQTIKKYKIGDVLEVEMLRQTDATTKKVVLKPFPVESDQNFDVLYDSIIIDGHRQRTILTHPKGNGRFPAILLVGGIGCYSYDYALSDDPYKKILYSLSKKGLVTLRVEKSGVGDSKGPPCSQLDFNAEVTAYLEGLKSLRNYDFVDQEKIFVFGHSIGGIIAPLLSSQFSLKGIIVADTVGISWFEYELENSRRQHTLAEEPAAQLDQDMRLKEFCMHQLLVEKQTPEKILKKRPNCSDSLQYPVRYTYMQQVADLDLPQLWSSVTTSVLVIFGKADYVTTAKEHRYIVNLLNRSGIKHATYVEIADMDHFLTRAGSIRSSYQKLHAGLPREFNPTIVNVIAEWLGEYTN